MVWNWQQEDGSWTAQEPHAQANPPQQGTAWERPCPPQDWTAQTQGGWQSSGPQGNAAGTSNGQQSSGNSEGWREAPTNWSESSSHKAQWCSDLEHRGRSKTTNWEARKYDSTPAVFWQSQPEGRWEKEDYPGPQARYISYNPWYVAMRDYADSFTIKPCLPEPAVQPSPEFDLIQIMDRYGMPRDPYTWMRWPDVYFPRFTALPNGWTRLWDETAHRIVCYRAIDGKVHLDLHPLWPDCPPSG